MKVLSLVNVSVGKSEVVGGRWVGESIGGGFKRNTKSLFS